jgi:hypothetical protein
MFQLQRRRDNHFMHPDMRELGIVKIASPCSEEWSKMKGDARIRFCGRCQLNVYNLSELSSDAASALIREREGGRLCVRFYARRDGTLLTRDCPPGLRQRLRRSRRVRTLGGLLIFTKLVLIALLTLFSDNLRRLLGSDAYTGALAGDETAAPPSMNTPHGAWPGQRPNVGR